MLSVVVECPFWLVLILRDKLGQKKKPFTPTTTQIPKLQRQNFFHLRFSLALTRSLSCYSNRPIFRLLYDSSAHSSHYSTCFPAVFPVTRPNFSSPYSTTMSAVTAPSNPSQTQNTKKRRGKAEASAAVAAPVSVAASNTDAPSVAAAADGSANGHHEPSFLRELQKYVRTEPRVMRLMLIFSLLEPFETPTRNW